MLHQSGWILFQKELEHCYCHTGIALYITLFAAAAAATASSVDVSTFLVGVDRARLEALNEHMEPEHVVDVPNAQHIGTGAEFLGIFKKRQTLWAFETPVDPHERQDGIGHMR